MELIIVIAIVYIGAPLGLVFILIGGIGLYRKKQSWPAVLLGLGTLFLIIAVALGFELANTNFGL